MVDSIEHVKRLETVAARCGISLPLCLEADMSIDLPGLHFGVWRSPVGTPEQARLVIDKNLGEMVFEHGLAQENLGDIDVQSISGAISTGNHSPLTSGAKRRTDSRAV